MSRPLVEPSGALASRWRRIGTLTAEQALINASPYAISWTFVRTAPVAALPGFYICWLWGWGLFAVLSELVLTPARVIRADGELPNHLLSAVILSACAGSVTALGVAAVGSVLGAGIVPSAAVVISLALSALAFFARRIQADEDPFGLVPRAGGYLVLAGAGSYALARAGWFTQVTAIGWAGIALIIAAGWGTPGRPFRAMTTAAVLLRQVWPRGRWYAAGTVMRVVLYSNGLITLIRLQRGAEETAAVAAMFVLVGPLFAIGTVLPWAHLPELRSALCDRELFFRIWLRQLLLYAGVLGVVTAALSALWEAWVRMSVPDAGLAASVSSQRPVALTLVVALVLTSWTGTALLALEKAKWSLGILTVSGILAMSSVLLGTPAAISVTLPYVIALALGICVVIGTLRSPGGRPS